MPTRRDVLALAVVGAVGVAGCARERAGETVPEDAVPHGAEAGEPIDDVLDRWREGRVRNEPFGVAATATLEAEELTVHADETLAATVEGPCRITREGPIDGGLICDDVTVDGEPADALYVHGSALEVEAGTLEDLNVDRVRCDDPVALQIEDLYVDDEPSRPSPPDDVEASTPHVTEYAGGPLQGVELGGFDEAFVIRDGERVDLSAPVTVTAADAWVANGAVVETAAATLETDRFSVAAPDGASGTVAVTDRADIESPLGVFGTDATLAVEPGQVVADDAFRLTQALTDDGVALGSTVDVLPATTSVSVPAGETRWFVVYYRERSYVGDGVLGDVSVDSSAEGLVSLPVEPPESVVSQVVESLEATGGAPAVAAFAPALVALVLGEGLADFFNCALDDCPSNQPYPSWIDAGAVDRFYYRVDASGQEPGTYEATVRAEGANYESVGFPVEVTVTEPTATDER